MPIRSTEQSTSIDAITNTNTNTNDTNTKRWTKCKQILLSTSWFTKLLEHCSLCLFPCLAKFLFPSHFGVFLWFSLCVQLFKQIYATVGIRIRTIVCSNKYMQQSELDGAGLSPRREICHAILWERFSQGKILNRSSVSG